MAGALAQGGKEMGGEKESDRSGEARSLRRRVLARDALVFQGKLLMDAFKDLVVGPVAFISAIIGLISPAPRKDLLFYKVMHAGKRVEGAINLFEAASGPGEEGQWTVDDVIREVESQLRQRYRSGPVSRASKQAIDESLKSARDSDENT